MWKINISGKGAEGNRMRTFGLYALCVILFFIFSNIMINITLKTIYEPIDTYKSEPYGIGIDIKEARATYVNCYVGGNITNRNSTISKTYMKIDLYTKRDVLVGTKYIEINDLKQNQTQEFRIGFKYTDVDHANINLVDEVSKDTPEEAFISEDLRGPILLTTVIFLCFFG